MFLITGVQTAVGFTISSESVVTKGGSVGADVPLASVVPGLELGGEVGGLRERSEEESYTVGGEVIIAYRVLAVKKRGWKRELSLADYRARDRSRMLGDEEKGEEMEASEVGMGDMGIHGDESEEEVEKTVVESEEGEWAIFST